MEDNFDWIEKYAGIYAHCLNGKLKIGISVNTESIHRTKSMKEGMVITLIISGNGIMKTEKGEFPISPGTIVFRHPKMDFSLTLYPQTRHRRCYIVIPEMIFDLLLELHPSILEFPAVYNAMTPMQSFLEDFMIVYNKVKETSDASFFTLLPIIERYMLTVFSPYMSFSANEKLLRAKNILESDYKSSLPEIAEKCELNYNTFRKIFLKTYMISPLQYRKKMRCEKAKQLLSMGYQCTEVADQLDFPDLYTFSHQFISETGQSPSEYRKKHTI